MGMENEFTKIRNLWDEIPKAIVSTMPEQLFPLFKEVYGREYPPGTPIRLLSTEYSTYLENPDAPPGSKLADIALLVNDTDFYHIECQMKNDSEMVIRMISYDMHFAIQHNATRDNISGELIIRFPHSVVIYPDKNDSLPDKLRCKIIFQDNSEHIYEIPTLKVQSYTLQEIQEKHLMFFIPFVLLRLRPKLKTKHSLTINELTGFVEEVILILQEELKNGNLTELQYHDYLNLFQDSANYILADCPTHRKEVARMTEPQIILPSMVDKKLRAEIARKEAELAGINAELADRDAALADKDAALADKDAALADKDAALADKDAQIAALTALLQEHNITIPE